MVDEFKTTYLEPEFKSITLMRWIRKGIDNGTFVELLWNFYNNTMSKIITEEHHFGLNVKTSKKYGEKCKYEGFDKNINGLKLVDDDYEKLQLVINDQVFILLSILLPLHPKYIDKICDAIREIK